MSHPVQRLVLRRHFTFDTAVDARPFAAEMAARSQPGMAVAVCLDARRRLVEFRPVLDAADHLADVLAFVIACGDRRTRQVLLLTDRTGETIVDRPDDELVWEELVGQATANDLVLLDWWVMFGTQAISVAEHAPTPAAW